MKSKSQNPLFKLLGIKVKRPNPVDWHLRVNKSTFNTYQLQITATIKDGWRLHSQESPLEGPLPTMISFEENTFINYKGMIEEVGDLKVGFNKNDAIETCYYINSVLYLQEIQLYTTKEVVKGTITYMPCTESKCLKAIEYPFDITLNQ